MSIDGPATYHNTMRGMGKAFETSVGAVRKMVERGIPVTLSMTVTRQNLNYVESTIDLAYSAGCAGIKIIPFLPAGKEKKFIADDVLNP